MYAIVEAGGKQHTANEGDVIRVEKLDAEVGEEVTLDRVLMLRGDSTVQVGSPYVEGASVTARVIAQGKGKKIHGFTFKAKKNSRRRFGHRQLFTEIRIESIQAG